MTDTLINDFLLTEIAKDYAKEIFDQVSDIDDGYELAHQKTNDCEWVSVYHKAHLLCLNCNTDNGEEFFYNRHSFKSMNYDEMGRLYAYGELYGRTMSALNDLFNL